MDHIAGFMYCKNEADILPLTIPAAMKLVDSMFITDDGSTDASWEIIKYFKQQYPDKIEFIQQKPNPKDQGQRKDVLNAIRDRYKPETTWVQCIDADMFLHTTDLHATIEANKRDNVTVLWCVMNAVRDEWEGIHQYYPNWPEDIRTIMPNFHRTELVTYSYRPFPDLYFEPEWRAWPKGFGAYIPKGSVHTLDGTKPPALLLHYGYRGPTHMMKRWLGLAKPGKPMVLLTKQGDDYTSLDSLIKTSPYFNGLFNRDPMYVGSSPDEVWQNSLKNV